MKATGQKLFSLILEVAHRAACGLIWMTGVKKYRLRLDSITIYYILLWNLILWIFNFIFQISRLKRISLFISLFISLSLSLWCIFYLQWCSLPPFPYETQRYKFHCSSTTLYIPSYVYSYINIARVYQCNRTLHCILYR